MTIQYYLPIFSYGRVEEFEEFVSAYATILEKERHDDNFSYTLDFANMENFESFQDAMLFLENDYEENLEHTIPHTVTLQDATEERLNVLRELANKHDGLISNITGDSDLMVFRLLFTTENNLVNFKLDHLVSDM